MTDKPPPADLTPPFNAQAEESVVASILVDPGAFDAVDQLVSTPDFYRDAARWTFAACRVLWQRDVERNEVTVAHELTRTGHFDDVGGLTYLSRIVTELPTPIGVEHYAQIVRRDARYRKAIQAGSRIVELAYKGGADIEGFVTECERQLAGLQDDGTRDGFTSIGNVLDEFWSDPGVLSQQTRLIRTGIMDLDELLAGLMPSNLIIVAAQVGHGKSTFLLNLARNAAVGQNMRVAILSLEMSRSEWGERMLARESGVEIRRIRRRELTVDQERDVQKATGFLAGLPIEIDDRGQVSIDSIRGSVRRLARRLGGIDLILVDYLQLIGNHKRFENRTQEVGAISRGLKLLAKELDVPIVAAAQLSRATEMRTPPIPRLSDLRESGSIEQDADVVVFMYREDKRTNADTGGKTAGLLKLIVAKHRNGQTGSVFARIDDGTAHVSDIEEPAQGAFAGDARYGA